MHTKANLYELFGFMCKFRYKFNSYCIAAVMMLQCSLMSLVVDVKEVDL